MNAVPSGGQKRVSDARELEFQAVVNLLACVLGITGKHTARTV